MKTGFKYGDNVPMVGGGCAVIGHQVTEDDLRVMHSYTPLIKADGDGAKMVLFVKHTTGMLADVMTSFNLATDQQDLTGSYHCLVGRGTPVQLRSGGAAVVGNPVRLDDLPGMPPGKSLLDLSGEKPYVVVFMNHLVGWQSIVNLTEDGRTATRQANLDGFYYRF
jgi:hypothetical protein